MSLEQGQLQSYAPPGAGGPTSKVAPLTHLASCCWLLMGDSVPFQVGLSIVLLECRMVWKVAPLPRSQEATMTFMAYLEGHTLCLLPYFPGHLGQVQIQCKRRYTRGQGSLEAEPAHNSRVRRRGVPA